MVSFRILVLASSVTCSASDKTWQCGQIKLTHVECLLGASTEGLSVKVQRWWCGLPFAILTVWAENKIVPIPFMRVLKLNLWLASARSSASCRDMDVFSVTWYKKILLLGYVTCPVEVYRLRDSGWWKLHPWLPRQEKKVLSGALALKTFTWRWHVSLSFPFLPPLHLWPMDVAVYP